jgi:hypothetical protein
MAEGESARDPWPDPKKLKSSSSEASDYADAVDALLGDLLFVAA